MKVTTGSSCSPQIDRTRRRLLLRSATTAALSALPALPALPAWAAQAASDAPAVREFRLRPARTQAQLVPAQYPATPVWAYNGSVPGPDIRVRQGDRVRIIVENALPESTTVHWHGLRVPNAMDGVPGLTQAPIAPEERFVYEFDVPDAGSFWYHPHQRSSEQVGRGLHGPLIVEEKEPIIVDRDITWVLDDWRLTRDASISDDFDSPHDMSHGGRIGNSVTINGQIPESFTVRQGERLRLRLINVANARHFALDFGDHLPRVIALDGQPVRPHEPAGGRVVLGPAMRADVVLDMTDDPGSQFTVTDTFYAGREYHLLDIVYGAQSLRAQALDHEIALPANPLAEPIMEDIERHRIRFMGGMMGGGGPDMMRMMRQGRLWFINEVAASDHGEPILTLRRDRSYLLEMINDTAWYHPIHLHGHTFRVMSRNGAPVPHQPWQDTVLMAPRETVEIAFVADNPGDWMFHCHILEHQKAGMMGVVKVRA